MGKLIKNHWARLIILVSSAYQIAAALHAFFWPKIFFDFLTKNLDLAVKPIPILQSLNLLLGILIFLYEYPLPLLSGTWLHRSIHARMVVYPMAAMLSVLLYQGTNPAVYYMVGIGVWGWAYGEGEQVAERPWTLLRKREVGKV